MGSSSLDDRSMFISVLFPLKQVWIPYLLEMFLKFSPRLCMDGMTMYPLDLLILLLMLFCLKFLYSILSSGHDEYFHLVKTTLKMGFLSVVSSSDVELTTLALWCSVFMTLCLAPMSGWLSKCKY